MGKIFDGIKLGNIVLKNRLVMSPMTRNRADEKGLPGKFAQKYYSERSSMGLIITEGNQPSEIGQGYYKTPGIYNLEQAVEWKKVIDAVHNSGGKIYIQLMHVGRMSHPLNNINKEVAIAPSAISPELEIFTPLGMKEIPIPREIGKFEIKETINQFRKAALLAIQAGADGVEIHGANGYLIHQFFGQNSNTRTDEYGGSIQNRVRFALEVANAVVDEIGSNKVGFRISPMNNMGGVDEGDDGLELYQLLLKELSGLDLSYLHIMHVLDDSLLKSFRNTWENILIVNRPKRPIEDLGRYINSGLADLESVGVWSLSNPDFPERVKENLELNHVDYETFYTDNGEVGYTDYPRAKKL